MKRISSVIMVLLVSLTLFAQAQDTSSESFSAKISLETTKFINELKAKQQNAIQRKENLAKALKQDGKFIDRHGLRVVEESFCIGAFVQIADEEVLATLNSLGVSYVKLGATILSCQIPVENLEKVIALPNVQRVEIAKKVHLNLDKARADTKADQVYEYKGLQNEFPNGVTGKGVVVGIIDGGFDLNHPNFYSADGQTYRIKYYWNPKSSAGSPVEIDNKIVPLGTEFTTPEAIKAQKTDNKKSSHGSHTTGIAAGSGGGIENGKYRGVAPESDIILVSYIRDDNTIAAGIKYIVDRAKRLNKPCVINMSLGRHEGSHDGTSLTAIAMKELADKGVIMVGSAGNEGNDKIHISHTFKADNDTIQDTILYVSDERQDRMAAIDIWSDKEFSVAVGLVDTLNKKSFKTTEFVSSKAIVDKEFAMNNKNGEIDGTLGSTDTLMLSVNATSNDLGKHHATVMLLDTFQTNPNYLPYFRITAKKGANMNIWQFANDYAEFKNGDTNMTVGELGGISEGIITVGSYVTLKEWTNLSGEDKSYPNPSIKIGNISGFSSKGPTADGRIKPDITAPGQLLASSVNHFDTIRGAKSAYTMAKQTVNGTDYYYGLMQGTSMSSPFVAGVIATWLQVNPTLTQADILQIMDKTARKDSFTNDLPNNTWGRGKIDAYAGLIEAIRMREASGFEPLTADQIIAFGKENAIEILGANINDAIEIYTISGVCIYRGKAQDVVTNISADKGFYVVKIGDFAKKVIVK